MSRRWLAGHGIPSAAAALVAATVFTAAAQAPRARTVELEVGDNMRFVPAVIEARPGERLRVVLKGVGKIPRESMAHNFVLLRKGTNPRSFAERATPSRETLAVSAAAKTQALAVTEFVGPGQTAEVSFEAPAQSGEYPFLCTFPGHVNLGMRGQLVVK